MKREPIGPPPEPTYAQSKQMENAPKPSLPAAPPIMKRVIYMTKEYMGGLCTKDPSKPSTLLVCKAEDTNSSERPTRNIISAVNNLGQTETG